MVITLDEFIKHTQEWEEYEENTELIDLIKDGANINLLYDALSDFFAIVYKAKMIKGEEEGEYQQLIFKEDIEKAKKSYYRLIEQMQKDESSNDKIREKCFEVLSDYYEVVGTDQAKSEKAAFIPNPNYNGIGVYGTFLWCQLGDDSIEHIREKFEV